MIVTIHQPDYLPWLGFFDRWQKSDLYIVLDDVQFIRRGWHHRDKIKTREGVKWLTVPVLKKGRYLQDIRDVKIDNQEDWRHNHLNIMQNAYGKAPHFRPVFDSIKEILFREHKLLIDLNMDMLKYCADVLQIKTPVTFSSEFQDTSEGTERLVKLVKAVGGDIYLTGLGSKDYLDEKEFDKQGIKVTWQSFEHPIYPQLHGAFEKTLSVIDFLMMNPEPKTVLG
ncbi:MAG: WbqC family protein [Desulfobacterales bacterium]|nr:WbqC family protein [Desulfobacterales bacterium]